MVKLQKFKSKGVLKSKRRLSSTISDAQLIEIGKTYWKKPENEKLDVAVGYIKNGEMTVAIACQIFGLSRSAIRW